VHDNAPIALATKTLTGSLTPPPAVNHRHRHRQRRRRLTAGANDIALDGATNSFGNVRIVSGNNVSIRDNTTFSFGGGAGRVREPTVDRTATTQAAGAMVAVGGTTTINTRGANAT
jgi:hypothetical protein